LPVTVFFVGAFADETGVGFIFLATAFGKEADFIALAATVFLNGAFAGETGVGFIFLAMAFGKEADAFAPASIFFTALDLEGLFKVFPAAFREVPPVFLAESFAVLAEDLDVV